MALAVVGLGWGRSECVEWGGVLASLPEVRKVLVESSFMIPARRDDYFCFFCILHERSAYSVQALGCSLM